MAIGDENNNYLNFNFNTFYPSNHNNNISFLQVSQRSANQSASQMTRSTSSNSLMSVCTNTSCSSISTLFENELVNDNDFKLIPVIPSEDVDADWLQFGYLLEDEENVLPKFESAHIHHHCQSGGHHNRQHRLQNALIDSKSNNEHNFQRSLSLPSTPDSQPCGDSASINEGSEFSFPSLRVEPPLTPPPSPLSLPYYDSMSHATPTTCPEKPFTKEEELAALQPANIVSRTSFYNNETLVLNDSEPSSAAQSREKDVEVKGDDEPIAKRTRQRDSNSSGASAKIEQRGGSFSSYYHSSPRPWWLDKLLAMRKRNVNRMRKRSKSKTAKATKRQITKKDANINSEDTFSLCDPRYISLGGNTVPFEEMPMKMELDLSGNAKITTQSDLLNKASQNNTNNVYSGGSGANEENDESDDDDDSGTSNGKVLSSKHMEEIGNDESENDSATAGGGDTSAEEEGDRSRTAKFASLTTKTAKTRRETAAERKLAAQEEKKREQKKVAKKTKEPKSRAIGQQHRRDRERRLQMIQMRKTNTGSNSVHCANENNISTKAMTQRKNAATKKAVVRKSIFAEKDNKNTGPAKYCPCGGPYDSKKVYVSCKQCLRWYHCKCAGVTEKRVQKMSGDLALEWTCPDCEKSAAAELYCVCRRPYDDTRFYVGCDSCEDWFHPECIGTTQTEVSKHDSFLCPKCRDDI